MRPEQAVAGNGRTPATAERVRAGAEFDGLRATCRRQAHVIDALGEAVSTFRGGAAALKAENVELCAENDRVRRGAAGARTGGCVGAGDALEVQAQGPGTATWRQRADGAKAHEQPRPGSPIQGSRVSASVCGQADVSREIEQLTGRKVIGFMSDNHIDPDLAVEVFVLEPLPPAAH